jgi:hypothetical protein
MKHVFRSALLALVLGLGCASSSMAEPLTFHGRWVPDDNQDAAYASLTIKASTISWRGPDRSASACVRDFVQKKERPGTVYRDGRGTKFVAGALGSMPTYLLTLSPGSCGSPGEEVRISFPLVYDINHIEFIEYVAGKPVSAVRLHRKK